MALASWKSFPFFNVTRVNPHDDNPTIFEDDIRAIASSSSNLFLGTGDGQVHILSSSFKLIRSFSAYASNTAVSHMQQVVGTSLLVTIGEDLSNEAVLRVWALDQTEKKTGAPKCLSSVTIFNGRKKFPVTSMAIPDDSLNPVAVAFANGSLTLIRGDLIHDRGTKQRIVFSSDEPITNLSFSKGDGHHHGHHHGHHSSEGETRLWLSTTTRLLCMHIDGSSGIMGARLGIGGGAVGGSQNDVRIVDAQGGVGVGCMVGIPPHNDSGVTGEVVVVRDDAIYFYSSTGGKGGCYAYEGPKSGVYFYKNYVALVSPPQATPSSGGTGAKIGDTFKRLVSGAGRGDVTDWDVTRFTILDTEGKYIAAQEVVVGSGGAGGVRGVFELDGYLWVLGLDGKLWRYEEKELSAKLNILYSRNLFLLAISLASKSPSVEPQRLNSIYRKYADYLYSKQDYDGAIQWYVKALGDETSTSGYQMITEGGEVSGVIRKYLDTQRIGNLIEYLEELHKRRGAGVDHTTLLVNCYAKGRDVAKLEKFIKSADDEKGETRFDVDTVIGVCRQGGYYEQAVYLAKKMGEDGVVVSILVENLDQYREALQYLKSLEPERAYPNLMKYARVLLKNAPEGTTDFFVEYYTGEYVPRAPAEVTPVKPASLSNGGGGGGGLAQYTSFLPQIPYRSSTLPNVTSLAHAGQQSFTTASPALNLTEPEPAQVEVRKYSPPPPRTAFSSFVDNPHEFIIFLESLLKCEKELKQVDKVDIYTTLFEMYLGRARKSKSDDEQQNWESKAKAIIQSNENLIDTILVREKQGLRFDIFRSCTSAGDTKGALKALQKYGPEEPQLYTAALAYFTSSPKVLEDVGEDALKDVLQKIDELGLMKPLQVVQTLSVNAVATVGMVKKYLGDIIQKERKEIQTNRKLIESYKAETELKKKEIAELGTRPITFQAQKCQACGMQLDLPIVHFLCKHSFHQRCLNEVEGDVECPTCQANTETIRAIRRTQDEQADRHDLFKVALADSKDKFATVSDWFGRGVMVSPPTVEG